MHLQTKMMELTNQKKAFLLVLPILLIVSTALVFVSLSKWVNREFGYVMGFIFYWLAWCFLVPFIMLKRDGIISILFNEENPLFRKPNWLPASLLIFIIAITGIMYPPFDLAAAPARLIIIAIPIAIVNGVCEELLWRGLYVRAFPNNPVLGFVYPSVGFALWHISPQLVLPAGNGIWVFVLSTFFLGISYGWIAYRTKSIKWVAVSHSLGGILDLGGFIAPSIMILLFQ